MIIEFDKFSKNFINAGSSIILLLILIPFMESFSDFSYQIFNISFVFVLDFFEYSSIFLIFLYYIVFFFIPDNFIHSSSQFDNSSVNDLVESSYSNLTLPFLPFSDKNLITLNIAYCLAIAFFTFLGINIVRSFLVAWYFFSDQYFYDHSYSLYFVYAFFIVFFEILWIYRFGKQLFIRNRDRSQREYNSWLNERNKMFSDLKEGIVNTKVSDPVSYLPSMINQYYEEKNKRSLAKVIKIAFGISFFFTIIFFLTNKFTLQELLMLFSVFFIIFFLMGIIPDKASSEIYRTMIDAALSNNIPVFVSEIVKYESNHKKPSDSSHKDETLFWLFKSRLLMIAGDYHNASLILQTLYKKIKVKFLLRSEVGLLLAQCFMKLDKSFDAEIILKDARSLFLNNNFNFPVI